MKLGMPGVPKSTTLFEDGDLAVVMRHGSDKEGRIYYDEVFKIYDDFDKAKAVAEALNEDLRVRNGFDLRHRVVIYGKGDNGWG